MKDPNIPAPVAAPLAAGDGIRSGRSAQATNTNSATTHIPKPTQQLVRRNYLTTARLNELANNLTELDRAILVTLRRVRLASGQQLRRLHFATSPSPERRCRQVLQRLTDRRLLARLDRRVGGLGAGSASFLYSLDIAGRKLTDETDTSRLRGPFTPGHLFISHTLAITELYVTLVEAERRNSGWEVAAFVTEPGCWQRFMGPGGGLITLKPDAFVQTATAEYLDSWFVEMDLGTESRPALARKCDVYRSYWQSGAHKATFPKVLFVVPDANRVAIVRSVLSRLQGNAERIFAVCQMNEAVAVMREGASS